MDEINKRMMLVIFLFLGAASFCHSKAFPEGSQISRGKRLYDHGQYTDQSYLQTYEDYWKRRGFYYPEVDGQPIYIPAINQPEKIMNEYIDHYYRNKPTEVPVLQSANPYNYHYESTTDLSSILNNFGEAKDNHYGNYHMIPETKHDRTKYQNFDANPEIKDNLQEYYTPEIVAKVKMDDYESKVQKEQALKNMDEKYEEPVTYKLYESAQVEKQKGKHVTPNLNDYELPTIKETVKHVKPKSTLSPSKKAKGKRKKQSHAQKKYGTRKEFAMPNEAIDQVLDFKSVDSLEDFKGKTEVPEYSVDKPMDSTTKKSEKKKMVKAKDTASKIESKEYEDQYIMEKDDLYYDTKETSETNEYEPTVKTKEKVKPGPKEPPVKIEEKVVVKPEPKEPPVKIKENVVVKPEPKEPPVKIKEKVVVKPEPKEPPVKIKEKVVVKPEPKEPPVKIKEKVVVKPEPKEPVKIKEKVVVKPELKEPPVKIKEKVVVKPELKEPPVKIKEKVVVKPELKEPVKIKEKVVVKPELKEPPVKIKEKVVVKPELKEPPVKIKEKVVVKPELKEPVKIKEKVVVKPEPKEPPVKIKEKVVVKPEPKEPPVKIKEKVVVKKTEPKEPPLKTKEKVIEKEPEIKVVEKEKTDEVKPESEEYPVKTKDDIKTEYVDNDNLKNVKENGELSVDLEMPVNESTDFEKRSLKSSDSSEEENASEMLLENESEDDQNRPTDLLDQELEENNPVSENVNLDESQLESKINSEKENSVQKSENLPKFLPNDALEKLSSLNSNVWSLVFNPNAQALNLKKCVTRSNETGHCTYVQHCEVPNLVTSLEQLLNNACVIDEIFIGVCCPEFPVETVKVHWDQPPSGSDTRIEDEFGHSAEGELIKSWCDGYEQSLTNLLTSFFLADCGIRSNEASKLQSWPWKAPLVSMSNGKIFCGGVLINEEYVLTAAHCTTKIPRNQILVRLGQYDDSTGDDFAVVEIKRHAQYNPRTLHNDIALLKLGRRIMLDDHTGIICLPEDIDEDAENDHVGEKATLLGWRGMFGTKSKDPESLKIMSNEECAKKLGVKIPDSLLCTDARNEDERTCNADSGAPLVIEDDGKFEVIGILSWNRNDCDQRFPSTFSRISNYVGWIQKHLN